MFSKFVVAGLPNCLSQRLTRLYFRALCVNQTLPHSLSLKTSLRAMQVKILPALKDNYMYLLMDPDTKEAAIVDPVEPDTVLHAVDEEGANLTTILTTHHHWDHAGGNEELIKRKPGLRVLGGDERIAGLTQQIQHLDKLKLGSLDVQCLFTPCHTRGHFCYYVTSDAGTDAAVFTGDTLFVGGCGRFFEGSSEEMYRALYDILGSLPDETKVFCGHEYSYQNLRFAEVVEQNNLNVKNKLQWVMSQRQEGLPTVPSTIAEEKTYNPFMRVTNNSVMQYANSTNEIEVMTVIRKDKDNFKI